MNILRGDVVVLQMDDELMIVDSVSDDAGVFLVHSPSQSPSGKVTDYYHEYQIDDVMTVYREVN